MHTNFGLELISFHFWGDTHCLLVVSYRIFETKSLFHPQGLSSQAENSRYCRRFACYFHKIWCIFLRGD